MSGLEIIATGHYVPSNKVSNQDMSKLVDTSDEWIMARTGISNRHFVENENTSSLAVKAAKMALDQSKIEISEIGYLIVATFTPDHMCPSVSCLVQRELGLEESILAFDLNAACSGFIYGLITMGKLLENSEKYGLVIGCEVISKVLDFTDRGTCILFGDGAGAALVKGKKDSIFYETYGVRGNDTELICEGTPLCNQISDGKVRMDGAAVFRFAVDAVAKVIKKLLAESKLSMEEIEFVVCHQANARIISNVQRGLKAPKEKFFMNVSEYANTSAASVPIALSEMNQQGMLQKGMTIICVGFGAGFTWGGVLLEW